MAGQPSLDAFVLRDWERRLRKLEAGAPMNNAAIGRSGMEVYDGGSINISNGSFYLNGYGSVTGTLAVSGTLPVTGGLIVSGTERITGSWFLDGVGQVAGTMTVTGGLIVDGTQRVSGTLEITGDLTVTGPTKLDGKTDIGGDTTVTGDLDVKGPLDVTGATKLDGKTDIGGNTTVDGTLDIKGKSTLQNDLSVQGGGKVKVGGMTLDPTIASGAMTFSNGAQVFTNGDSIQMLRGNGVVQVTGDRAALQWGGNSFSVDGGGRRVSNLPTSPEKANVYVDSSGYLHRSTAD